MHKTKNPKKLHLPFKGPSGDQLAFKGCFMGYLQKGDVTIKEEISICYGAAQLRNNLFLLNPWNYI